MTNDTSQAPVASTINSYIDAVSFSDAVRNLVVWSSAHKADEPRPWVYVSRKHFGSTVQATYDDMTANLERVEGGEGT